MNFNEIKDKIILKQNLSLNQTKYIFDEIMTGKIKNEDIKIILTKLKEKGETKEEILGATQIMREKSLKISSPNNTIDTCGTGGDMSGTLNISTSAALIAASAGVVVAKHGNRSVSSKSGSADFLEKLGLNLSSDKTELENMLDKYNFCFLFAQFHHSAMKYVIKVRKELKTRTIFNLLGPLTNPASTKKQLLGVFEKKWVRIHCEVLKELGSKHAMVVHGKDGLDEISLSAPTFISELKDNQIKDYIFDPKEYGYNYININSILGKDAEYNSKAFINMLEGKNKNFQKILEINAGAAIYISGLEKNLKDSFSLAKQVIESQKTLKYIKKLINN